MAILTIIAKWPASRLTKLLLIEDLKRRYISGRPVSFFVFRFCFAVCPS
jgi:hypothetical protein